MTIAATPRTVSVAGTGASQVVPFAFRILESGHLVVYEDGVLLTAGVDYTVSGTFPGTGSVTLTAAAGATVEVRAATPMTQATDLDGGQRFYEDAVEAMADKATMLIQELSARIDLFAANLGGVSALLMDYGTAAPTSGSYVDGWIRWNSAPVPGGNAGWIKTASGWRSVGAIDFSA